MQINASREPVVVANLILAALPALVGFLAAFGIWEPDAAQIGALSGLYVTLAAVVIYVLRGVVYSPDSVQKISNAVELVRTAPDNETADLADRELAALLPAPTISV